MAPRNGEHTGAASPECLPDGFSRDGGPPASRVRGTRDAWRSDPAPLGRAAAVVRLRGHVVDRADLEADGLEGADRGLTAGAGTLDVDVDLAHAVVHRLAGGGLGAHLRGVGGRLPGALEAHLARGGPGDHGTGRVGDRHDGVVEGALDVSLPLGDVLLLCARVLRTAASLRWHLLRSSALAGLLLSGDSLLGALARTRVGLGALTVDREPVAVPQALVAVDLDLATDVGLHLAAQVALDLVVLFDVVAELHQFVVGE